MGTNLGLSLALTSPAPLLPPLLGSFYVHQIVENQDDCYTVLNTHPRVVGVHPYDMLSQLVLPPKLLAAIIAQKLFDIGVTTQKSK